jgi:hypothetical protein
MKGLGKLLIIGITDGLTPTGEDKVQIIMFLDNDFAASIQGKKWSEVFPGTRHSVTIEKIVAASKGDQTARKWFSENSFKGVGNPAAFDTGKGFSVGVFSAFDQIGSAMTFGNWVLNRPIDLLPAGVEGTINTFPTAVISESATDEGPFDIQFSFGAAGQFAVDPQYGAGLPVLHIVGRRFQWICASP